MYNNQSFDEPNQGDPIASFRNLFTSIYDIPENAFNYFYESLPTKSASRIASFIHLTATRDNINNMMQIFHNARPWQIEPIIDELSLQSDHTWLNNSSIASLATSYIVNLDYALEVMTNVLSCEGNNRILECKTNFIKKTSDLFQSLSAYNSSITDTSNINTEEFIMNNIFLNPENFKSENEFSRLITSITTPSSTKWINDPSAVKFVYENFKNSFKDFDYPRTKIQILNDIKSLHYKEQIIYVLKYNSTYLTALGSPALSHKDKNVRSKAIHYMEQIFLMMNEPACNVFINSFFYITDIEEMRSEYNKIIGENPQLLRTALVIDGNTPKIKGLHQVEEALSYIEKSTDSSQIRALSTSAIEYIDCIKNIRIITHDKARDIKEKILDVAMHSISKLENPYHNHSSNVRSI